MDRNREARRATLAATNGLPRRRHRSGSLRDSPEEDGVMELQETARLRDRGSGKKERERDRDQDRDRDRGSKSSKRRRPERLVHGSNRDDIGDATSEESVNDEEEEDDDDGGGGGAGAASMRMLPPNPSASLSSSSMSNHHRKSFPPPPKVFRASPTWKVADEMIGVSVPRKARSASTKRPHECSVSGGVGGEQIHRQASTSPVRPGLPAIAGAPAPVSPPSSSNASVRKKMKPNGSKPHRPPKSSSKSSSSAPDEIEFEIAEVLYGMMRQPLCPSKQESMGTEPCKFDSREAIKSTGDAKSRVSSPISNSPFILSHSSSILPQNSSPSTAPMSAVAPKRKRPRPVIYPDENPSIFNGRNSPVLATNKVEIDQSSKFEISVTNMEKTSGSAAENGGASYNLSNSQAAVVASLELKYESNSRNGSRPLTEELESGEMGKSKEGPQSPKKESTMLRLNVDIKANSAISEIESQREEKFQIDLMAPPPLKLSPEREGDIDYGAVDPKPMVSSGEIELKHGMKEDEKNLIIRKEDVVSKEVEEKKAQSHKPFVNMERVIDLQLDLEKPDRDIAMGVNKLNQHVEKQHQHPSQPNKENTAQSNSLSMPMQVASWPGGLPPMGYMAPLQGVVSMDGSTLPSAAIQPPHLLFTQPRPQRCATHCYIARNICYHQQFTRMNPFWPAAAGSASLYGAKACNLNVVPSIDLHGNNPGRTLNSTQDKGLGLAMFPGHSGKDKCSQATNNVEAVQRKQIMMQQALPPVAPNNILQGPAFIFPLSQQQAAAAASVRPGTVKSPPTAGSASSSSGSNSAAAAATAMSFNYPNMPGNETQYLAILQNNAYPFPIPAHVGAPPAYRGSHAHAMPFFNGSFYSSQMLHPSQIQQQQPPVTQLPQIQQGHQNTSIASGSSSSQKHLQNQQHRPHGSGSLQGFPASKNQPSQPLQQRQNHAPHQARQLENELGSEDSPSTADSRVSRANTSIYGQNYAMPMHPPNFALMSAGSLGGAGGPISASGNHSDKKQQQQGPKTGIEALHSQAFAMSFANMNGANPPGLDMSSFAQNHAILQSLPEATRHNFHTMANNAAAQAAQQKKNYRVSEEGKGGGDSSVVEEERKGMGVKAPATVGQSIAFSRPDLTDSVSAISGSNVIDSSARNLNLSSAPVRPSGSVMPTAISAGHVPSSQQRAQQQHQQHQQMLHLHKQQQFAAATSRSNKTPATSNGNAYSDHLPSSSIAGKFSTLSTFPQNLVQSSNSSPAQSPQWKNSARTTTSQVPSTSHAPSTSSSLKNLPQQPSRSHQNHTQISFASNPKPSTAQPGQQLPNSNQTPSPPVVVGSPTTSMSKSAGGSPRTTTSSSAGNKVGQVSSFSSQQARNSPPVPSRKSSPVGGRNVPSILGNPSLTTSSAGAKPHAPQQQQQLPKQALQQTQLFFSNYMHSQAPHSSSTTSGASGTSGYYPQRRRSEQQQQPQGLPATSSNGMLSLCAPVSLTNASTSDPAKALVAASNNMKGGVLPAQGLLQAAQFAVAPSSGNQHQIVPTSFPYVHAVPSAVQVKPTEQKQPAA